MKSLLMVAALLLQSPPTPTQTPASIEGMVVDKQMRPVAGAEVSAFWDPPPMTYQPDQLPRTNTDTAGKFVISNLAPGGYRIFVSATGYVPQTYGAKTAGNSGATGTVISLIPGQTAREVTVPLTAASTISGRVVSGTGEPLSGMNVNAVRIAFDSSGLKTFVPVGSTQSDDRGEYRIGWLPPGRYFVRAETSGTRISNELLQRAGRPPISRGAYAAMYYPGASDVSGASLVEIGDRDDIRGINFVLPRLETFTIRGHVLDENGQPPSRPTMTIMPLHPDFITSISGSVTPYCGTSQTCENPSGAFELPEVSPGTYWLTAQISVPLTPEQRELMQTPGADPALLPQPKRAAAAVRVTNADVDGIELRFYSRLTMTGRILIDDSNLTTLHDSNSIKIGFRESFGSVLGPAKDAVVDAQGKFSTGNLLPGEYRVDVRDLPPGVFLVDTRLGDRDVSTDFIRILSPQSDELNIRLSAKSGKVNGEVVDSLSKPVPNAVVVLVPLNESNRPDRYKTATARGDGRFHIEGIAPGDYTAFSWEALEEDNAWFDPKVVRQFEAKGKLVHVVAASNEELQLTQIPAGSN
jgi:hypothetical protein